MPLKKNGLLKRKDLVNLGRGGRSNYNNLFRIKLIKNNLSANRFVIVVSSKISKKAVERNKIKRQIRAIIKSLSDRLNVAYDVLIIALPDIIGKKFNLTEQALTDNFRKIRLLKQ